MPRFHLLSLPTRLRRRVRRNRLAMQLLLLAVLLAVVVPLFSLYCVYRPPRFLMTYLRRKFPDVLFELPPPPTPLSTSLSSSTDGSAAAAPREKLIALSLDDAPSAHTDEIMRILAANDAHATFFVIGSQALAPQRAPLLRALVAQGHELANHAMHDEPSAALPDAALLAQLDQVKGIIAAAYEAEHRVLPNNYFRPGSGLFTRRMRDLLGNRGFRIVLGSVYPHDAQLRWPRLNARHVLGMAREGAIVVCHDRRAWTPDMLRLVLPELRRRGFRVVTITELVKSIEHFPLEDQGRDGAAAAMP
ncbi:Bifunctional xylanase/deacetylase [Escovopsis weberi]|uniref:chitin deacetylase n=1 Tax=Escovopsis weberi TaxID=150374 RepID=A0A0M8N4F6_ESCWE|nr:Bifunctional xylanase/deacetylase [Escovopsis weberi]